VSSSIRIVQSLDGLRADGEGRPISRRRFAGALGSMATAILVGGSLGSCGGDSGPTSTTPKGRLEGTVTDRGGVAQPSLGKIFLMTNSGLMTGRSADVDGAAQFFFDDIDVGNWQIRFHAPRIAYVPEDLPHPLRFTIEKDKTTTVQVKVERGFLDEQETEIYCGDDFFYEVPFGVEGGTTTVKLGTSICWYNVGVHVHTVTGGPWVDSGELQRTGSFVWRTDRVGTFPYVCTRHSPLMRATLEVTA
jgi:hypothetical protein